jgi:hypothetical protein
MMGKSGNSPDSTAKCLRELIFPLSKQWQITRYVVQKEMRISQNEETVELRIGDAATSLDSAPRGGRQLPVKTSLKSQLQEAGETRETMAVVSF